MRFEGCVSKDSACFYVFELVGETSRLQIHMNLRVLRVKTVDLIVIGRYVRYNSDSHLVK